MGTCKVVELFGMTEDEIAEKTGYIVERLKELSDNKLHITTFAESRWDSETGYEYWEGVILYDLFLDKWTKAEEIDPATVKPVVDNKFNVVALK
jgi:hypothetical protein